MRTQSISTLFLFAAAGFIASCSGDSKQSHGHDHGAHASGSAASEISSEPQFEVNSKFQEQLADVFESYVDLKEALVSSDMAKVKSESQETSEALAKVDMTLVSGAAHNDWMVYLDPMKTALEEIQGAGDLEAQRTSFSTLTNNLYKSIKAFGLGGEVAYYEFCPMAFNNQGGYWLSDNEKIRNPYFGDKMLTCGEVQEKLQ